MAWAAWTWTTTWAAWTWAAWTWTRAATAQGPTHAAACAQSPRHIRRRCSMRTRLTLARRPGGGVWCPCGPRPTRRHQTRRCCGSCAQHLRSRSCTRPRCTRRPTCCGGCAHARTLRALRGARRLHRTQTAAASVTRPPARRQRHRPARCRCCGSCVSGASGCTARARRRTHAQQRMRRQSAPRASRRSCCASCVVGARRWRRLASGPGTCSLTGLSSTGRAGLCMA
mmetsp:Transcript_42620/g.127915  ORF Transcript_42620/g.127915 Transcript_42620/m.127915 type:complete len:227 (-) Transcript_42620:1142-1822(-)